MAKKIFEFFIYSNLFIALCAVALVHQTFSFLLNTPSHKHYLLFVFFSSLCSYSFHFWFISEPGYPSSRIIWVRQNRWVHALFFFTGLAGVIVYIFYLLPWWEFLAITAIMTFLYSAPKVPHPVFRALRKIAYGKTIFLALVWTMVTTILPILISGKNWTNEFLLFTIGRFFLFYAICILFDYRDREQDKAAGLRSLITYLNEKGIRNLFIFSLMIFMVSTLLLLRSNHPAWLIGIHLLPGIILACLFEYARKNFSDTFYYFVLDGLLALSAFLMIIILIIN